ncbi:ROK family protein [uncultured Shimia sp.]|uniref:ROK family protein n=1 Tax=uncultured Shimia sp. TaxID=573152 RepID=UPI0025EBE56A|nr:ROK family protein [uncultured Shimia sp.]
MVTHTVTELNGFAVDLGGTKLAAVSFARGKVQNALVRKTKSADGPATLVRELEQISKEIGYTQGAPIGVAVAGKLDDQGLWSSVNHSILKDLDKLPLAKSLANVLGAGVVALNDTQAAAIGEHRYGAGQDVSSLAYLTVSTGISAGFVLNGASLHSPNGMLGHVGAMVSRNGERQCGCGRIGTYESMASGRAIEAMAGQLGHGALTCHQVFAAAAAGEHWAQTLFDDACSSIAELCANLVAVLGVERVVLGGGVGLADGFLSGVKRHLAREPMQFQPQIVPAGLGKHSAMYGALSAAITKGGSQ